MSFPAFSFENRISLISLVGNQLLIFFNLYALNRSEIFI